MNSDKYNIINQWLHDLAKNHEEIPKFEINKDTIDILYDIYRQNQKRDKENEYIIEESNEMNKYYKKEADRYEKILENTGITLSMNHSFNKFSHEKDDYLNLSEELSNISLLLETKDCNISNIMLSLSDLDQKESDLNFKCQEIEYQREEIKKLSQQSIELKYHLQRVLKSWEEKYDNNIIEEMEQNIKYFDNKCKEYIMTIRSLEERMRKNGNVNSNIQHSSLISLHESIVQLNNEFQPCIKRFNQFHNLYPDMNHVQLKIEEATNELNRLEIELTKKIQSMAEKA